MIHCHSGRRHVSSEYPGALGLPSADGEMAHGFVNECACRPRRLSPLDSEISNVHSSMPGEPVVRDFRQPNGARGRVRPAFASYLLTLLFKDSSSR